jgi:hypothetical protein
MSNETKMPVDQGDPEAPLTRKERVDVALEAWKKTVDVQMHFNDIEIRIRNLAITVVGAVFSVAGLILKDDRTSNLPGAVVLLGGILCLAFFFMDGGWYHRLLHGAVEHGRSLESYIVATSAVPVGLANTIKETSPLDTWFGKMRSDHKIISFYTTLFGVSVIFAIVLWVGAANARTRDSQKTELARQDSLAAVARRDAQSEATLRNSLAAAKRADSARRAGSARQRPLAH